MLHYLQLDPSRYRLPRDPMTGRIKAGPGRPKGQNGVITRLAKGQIREVFEQLGGAQGFYEWAMRNERNKHAFYIHVVPRLLGAETLDAAAERLAQARQRPEISRIESVIVDPKDDLSVHRD